MQKLRKPASHVQAYKRIFTHVNQAMESIIRNTITEVTYSKKKMTCIIVATLVQHRVSSLDGFDEPETP